MPHRLKQRQEGETKTTRMEDAELDDSADGGSTSHFVLSLISRGNDARLPTRS